MCGVALGKTVRSYVLFMINRGFRNAGGAQLGPPRETVKKGLCPFLTKGLQSAARTSCPLTADKTHTCSLSCIFCQVHAPTENDQNPFAACRRQTLRGFFDRLTRGAPNWAPRVFFRDAFQKSDIHGRKIAARAYAFVPFPFHPGDPHASDISHRLRMTPYCDFLGMTALFGVRAQTFR